MRVMFERPVQIVLCQCQHPCFLPFRVGDGEDAQWSDTGCLKVKGHEGKCGLDGPGIITYREPPERIGPRVLLREIGENVWAGTCSVCGREYKATVSTVEG